MTEEEEVEYIEYEEEEVIEDDSSDELLQLDFTTSYDSKQTALKTCVNTYNALRPYNEIFYNGLTGLITINLLANVLPLSLQSILNISSSPVLLKIEFCLNDYDWQKYPNHVDVKSPLYNNNFVGIALVRDLFEKFFSPSYKVKKSYRSKPFLLASQKIFPQSKVKEIIELGFTVNQANSALEEVGGNLEYAINLLRTGILPQKFSSNSSIAPNFATFSSCPILYLILEIVEIYLDLTDHCCICRKPLIEPTIKPAFCESPKCRQLFEEIGIGTTALQEIKRDPIVADLLFTVFASSIGKFLDPAPPGFTDEQMTAIFQKLPSVKELSRLDSEQALCTWIGIDAYKLIRWILLTNKSHFLAIPNELRIKEIISQYQFLTLISSMKREEEFKRLKNQYGSMYLWHGSGAERWYSILRNGLKNYSNTKHMIHGNAYGNGIYFAREIATSRGYQSTEENKYKAGENKSFNIIALCEVIKDSKFLKDHGGCHTLTNENECIVRFLFINVQTPSFDTMSRRFNQIPTLSKVLDYYADVAKIASDQAKKEREILEKERKIREEQEYNDNF